MGTGHAGSGGGTSRGRPALRAGARRGPPRRDEGAAGWPARLVMGRGDAWGDRVRGTEGPWWRRGPRPAGGDVCRHRGERALVGLPWVAGAVASGVGGAWTTGWGSEAGPWWPFRGTGGGLAGASAPTGDLGASGARRHAATRDVLLLEESEAPGGGKAMRSGTDLGGAANLRDMPGHLAAARGMGDIRAGRRRRADPYQG